jgi:hypothetical protein
VRYVHLNPLRGEIVEQIIKKADMKTLPLAANYDNYADV